MRVFPWGMNVNYKEYLLQARVCEKTVLLFCPLNSLDNATINSYVEMTESESREGDYLWSFWYKFSDDILKFALTKDLSALSGSWIVRGIDIFQRKSKGTSAIGNVHVCFQSENGPAINIIDNSSVNFSY